ncbi:MAG: NAD(P)/FAD-dependent oxidoreductase [Xenococcaceae cyanobacterium]
MYDLIIIGGGPAGLTAAIYAIRKRLEVLLVSKNLGGKTNYRLQLPDVEHHLIINGEEIVNRFLSEIQYLDFARVTDEVEKVEAIKGGYRVDTSGGQRHETKTLIVATGTEPQFLNVPGERDYLMRGLCFSAMSYAPLFIERTTIVVGDTNLALMAAMELALIASQVVLVAPTRGELDTPLGKRLQVTDNVLILEGYQPQAVQGDLYARSLVVAKEGNTRELFADGIFVELGLKPNSKIVADLVKLEADGRIKVDFHHRTSAPGIFAAGDVTNGYAEQVLIAIGEGAKAALAAYEYLLKQQN